MAGMRGIDETLVDGVVLVQVSEIWCGMLNVNSMLSVAERMCSKLIGCV